MVPSLLSPMEKEEEEEDKDAACTAKNMHRQSSIQGSLR